MEINYSLFSNLLSHQFLLAAALTLLSLLLALLTLRSNSKSSKSLVDGGKSLTLSRRKEDQGGCCNCNGGVIERDNGVPDSSTGCVDGGTEMMASAVVVAAERQTGASMMEQLVPEITTHVLSYLDYPSLCRLSMTNSLMRKAANDDNAWKALYHKDFTLEQDGLTPVNGWKAYYASTRALVTVNAEFFNIIRERSLPAMSSYWLNADYVKCVHAPGELFSGYNSVVQSWRLGFDWEQGVNFQVRNVRVRVLTDMAWVTMNAYVDVDTGPFNMTNVFEFHNSRWFMVHHHSSVMMEDAMMDQQIVHA